MKDLVSLKERMLETASTGADYEAVAGVQGAIEASQQNDEASLVASLKKAGAKALEIGIDIGTKVAVKALESAAGLST